MIAAQDYDQETKERTYIFLAFGILLFAIGYFFGVSWKVM